MADIVEQARQHVATFEALGGTVAYPWSVAAAMKILSQDAELTRLRSQGERAAVVAATVDRCIEVITGQGWYRDESGDVAAEHLRDHKNEIIRALAPPSERGEG